MLRTLQELSLVRYISFDTKINVNGHGRVYIYDKGYINVEGRCLQKGNEYMHTSDKLLILSAVLEFYYIAYLNPGLDIVHGGRFCYRSCEAKRRVLDLQRTIQTPQKRGFVFSSHVTFQFPLDARHHCLELKVRRVPSQYRDRLSHV